MDYTRLDTLGVLSSGILNRRVPENDIPEDRESFDTRGVSRKDSLAAIESGKLLDVPEYYGCVHGWKAGDKYRGLLLQYRNITENPTFDTADDLLDWFDGTVSAVEG